MEEPQFKLTTPPESELPKSPQELIFEQLQNLEVAQLRQEQALDELTRQFQIFIAVHETGK